MFSFISCSLSYLRLHRTNNITYNSSFCLIHAVVCSPYYPAESELGFYSHYPKVLQPGLIKKRPKPDTVLEKIQTSQVLINDIDDSNCFKQETLSLFPLEPTGVLQTRSSSPSSSLASTSAVISTTAPSSSSAINGDHQPYFDFFSGSGCCESD